MVHAFGMEHFSENAGNFNAVFGLQKDVKNMSKLKILSLRVHPHYFCEIELNEPSSIDVQELTQNDSFILFKYG
jgi:hypothetical protein